MTSKELGMIREEIKELLILYKNLIDVNPLQEPTRSDRSFIKKKEKIVKESTLIRALEHTGQEHEQNIL